MLGLMQDKQKKYNGRKPGLGILIIFIVMVLGYVFDSGVEIDFSALLPVLIIAGAFLIVLLFTKMIMKTQSSSAAVKSPGAAKAAEAPKSVRPSVRRTRSEEAVHCAHSRGKQKYLEQIDSFLANGVIDKAEYRVLKERYEKLDLPDDFH